MGKIALLLLLAGFAYAECCGDWWTYPTDYDSTTLLHLPFRNFEGADTSKDETGNGNHMILPGGTSSPTWSAGVGNNYSCTDDSSYYFDGTDYGTIVNPSATLCDGQFSMSVWLNAPAGGSMWFLTREIASGGSRQWSFFIQSSKLSFRIGGTGAASRISSPVDIPLGVWFHAVTTRCPDDTVRVYQDTILVAQKYLPHDGNNTENILVGTLSWTPTVPYTGFLDEILIDEGVCWTQEQIVNLYLYNNIDGICAATTDTKKKIIYWIDNDEEHIWLTD